MEFTTATMQTSVHHLTSKTTTDKISEPLIKSDVFRICQWVISGFLGEAISIFGTVSNIINLICFTKQGFKDSVNVNLCGLAISDLGSVATLIFANLCYIPTFQDLDLTFEPTELQYLIAGTPHVLFTRITAWITAIITLERCLCITMPLKVKSLFTPQRAAILLTSVFAICIVSVIPVYYANRLGYRFSFQKNRTILGVVFTPDRVNIERVTFIVNNMVLPLIAFVVVIVCTTCLVVTLQRKAKWREESTMSGKALATSVRDQKVARMVVVISAMFISCYFPVCFVYLAMALVPDLSVNGKYRDALVVVGGFGFILESMNSALNIFVYYYMSSKYKCVFHQLFRLRMESESGDRKSRQAAIGRE